ncbi:DUF222 domain-containing protein [Actinotalea ferrariae]|uniref:HNH endonuclease signature motif containing protein n=1 Tax=Actinotalea ferrariae TaxID=1386098 RepID=UPI001C8C8658|nr:HNH endonuclease signature motif containing protein [Actinotalea ferrariae]MBX9244177.1 DUF222 domain-containing protein [Actinotalea ferrariae]
MAVSTTTALDSSEARTATVVGSLERAVRELSSLTQGAAELGPGARGHLLSALDRAVSTLTALRGQVLVAERSAGTWRGRGDPTFASWRARTSRAGARPVLAQLRQADTAALLPRLGAAAREGAVTADHMEALARVVSDAAAPVQDALAQPEVQEELLAVASRVDAGTFGRAAARIAARLDPRGLERSHQAQRAARYLHVTDAADGTRVSGLLDRMAGHRLRLALEAVSPRPAADDERTSEQRRADALDVLAEAVLADPRTAGGAAVRPHVSFHMSESTWAAIRAERRARAAEDARSAGPDGADGGVDSDAGNGAAASAPPVEPVTLDDGTPVPPSEVARALCDCEFTRMVIDADGVPLDIGRARRTYTGAHRRAVVARDRGCGWAGCDAQARWCEVHHIRWWDRDDGPTSVENGVLLCTFHHHEVHRLDLAIRRVGPAATDGRMTYSFTSAAAPPGVGRTPSAAAPPGGRRTPSAAPPPSSPSPPGSTPSTRPPLAGALPTASPPDVSEASGTVPPWRS